jgi:hypothetical protein
MRAASATRMRSNAASNGCSASVARVNSTELAPAVPPPSISSGC